MTRRKDLRTVLLLWIEYIEEYTDLYPYDAPDSSNLGTRMKTAD